MKAYLVKYALSSGVEQIEASEPDQSGYVEREDKKMWGFFKLGRDAFESEFDALDAARAMRNKKIAPLKKQIAKLEKMKFCVGREGKS